MATVSAGRNTDLGELELRAAWYLTDIEGCDGIVIRPPPGCAPCLHDLLAGVQHQIDPRQMRSPSGEVAADLLADPGWLT